MDSLRDMRLVERAAKAAGYGVARWSDDGRGLLLTGVQEPWNPVEDDGDAARLAAHLRMVVDFSSQSLVEVRFWVAGESYPRRNVGPPTEWKRLVTQAGAILADLKTPNV